MGDTPTPKTWGELLEWQRAWFEKGWEASGEGYNGEYGPSAADAYNEAVKYLVLRQVKS